MQTALTVTTCDAFGGTIEALSFEIDLVNPGKNYQQFAKSHLDYLQRLNPAVHSVRFLTSGTTLGYWSRDVHLVSSADAVSQP